MLYAFLNIKYEVKFKIYVVFLIYIYIPKKYTSIIFITYFNIVMCILDVAK